MEVKIVIKSFDDPNYKHTIGVMGKRKAEKVTRGLLRQINTDKYYFDEEEVDDGSTR